METSEISEGISVEIIHLNRLPSRILERELGTRREGASGIVVASLPGFDSEAFLIELREPFGEKTGESGIYFPGEFKRIPDLPPH
jgi:hypothetical protein